MLLRFARCYTVELCRRLPEITSLCKNGKDRLCSNTNVHSMGSGNKCGASCFILANLDAGPAAVLTCSRVLAGRLFTLTQHILDCLRRSTRRALFTGHNKALRSGLADLTCSLAVDSIFFFTISDYAAAIIQIVGCYLHCNFTGTAAPQDYSLAMKKKWCQGFVSIIYKIDQAK